MPTRSSTKKIHPYVPSKLYEDAESLYREQVAAKVKGAKVTAILIRWITFGWLVYRATKESDVRGLVRDFRLGKQLTIPVDGAS